MARLALAALLPSLILAGCSSEPSRYAAAGSVTIDGKPAPFVVLRFHPASPGSTPGGSGTTDQDGKFSIGQDGKNTGFPSGEYKVTFSQTLVNGKPTLAGSGGKAAEREATEKEAVADEFRDLSTTPIAATVGGGPNTFTFDIKSKK